MDKHGRRSRSGYVRSRHWLTLSALLLLATVTAQAQTGLFRTDAYLSITRGSTIRWALNYDRLVDSLRNVTLFIDRPELADSMAVIRALLGGTGVTSDSLDILFTTGPRLLTQSLIKPGTEGQVMRTVAGVATWSTSIREEIRVTGYANFANATNDSINIQMDGNPYHIVHNLYDTYADRMMLGTAKPSSYGPTTWRNDLPIVTQDSCYIVRISRNASFSAGSKIGLTLYKVIRSGGLSYNNTAGVFYDMIRLDEASLPAAGTSVQVFLTLYLAKRR